MKWFFAIFFSFSVGFLLIFGTNCFYGYIFPIKYTEQISQACETFDVDRAVVFSVINVESHFNKDAISPKGAVGLMQILPSTAEEIREELGFESFDLKNPTDNIFMGTYYISKLQKRFEDQTTALASYNAGPTVVSNWLKDERYSKDGKQLEKIPFAETKNYIEKYKENLRYYSKKV